MIQELNTLPIISPAFNKNLLQLESDEINNEKYNYILDTLTERVQVQSVQDAINGFGEYSGYLALFTVNQALDYRQGDSVVFFDIQTGTYTGIYKVLASPNNDTVILDSPYLGVQYLLQTNWLFKISRNKLPVSPDGTATFNANGFATGLVGLRFDLEDKGMFNVFENFTEFEYLANEEFYQPITGGGVTDSNGLVRLTNQSRIIPIGSIVQLIGDNVTVGWQTEYNGIWEVLSYDSGDMVISAPFNGSNNNSWLVNVLPKDVTNELDYNNVSSVYYAFNGALPKHEVLGFDEILYDASETTPCKFLTTIPDGTNMRIDSRGYIQFFQSDKLTCNQYAIEVTDQVGVIQTYIVNLNGVNDELLGISIGAGDLNTIPLEQFETIPTRGLPIIQECDKSYEVYLWGTEGCETSGTQTVAFINPFGQQVLNPNYWNAQQWGATEIEVTNFEIGGISQPIFPTGTVYPPSTIYSQSYENIYPSQIEVQTGGVLNVQSPTSLYNFGYPFQMDINFSQDFRLEVRIVINSSQFSQFYKVPPPAKVIDAVYVWDSVLCQYTYYQNGKLSKGAFIGVQQGTGGGASFIELSERKKFKMDWSCCTYTGARLIFEDRLGSMAGFNFTLKQFDDMIVSTDGFEQDGFSVERTIIDRGFKTIQASYTHKLTINSDYITEQEMEYLSESFSSPNIFVQYIDGIAPCIILPATRRITKKENSNLIRVTMDVQVNGTNYSQRN